MFSSHYALSKAWGVNNTPFPHTSSVEISTVEVAADAKLDDQKHSNELVDDSFLEGEEEAKASEFEESNLQIELLKRGKRSPATDEQKLDLIKSTHLFGHFGREAIFKQLWNKGYYWPGIRKQIETELKNCDACTRFVVVKQGFHPAQFITANGPWDHIQIDTSTHMPKSPEGHTALLVVIDVFTGFVILRAVINTTAEVIAKELWEIFCILGFPKIIQSDNGSEFVNDTLRSLVKITGIEHRLISAYNPRADGKVERSIGSVMMIIKKLLNGTSIHWNLFVPFAQITFNNKISSLTSSSPFALMFGRELNELKDYSTIDPSTSISLDDWKQHQEKILSLYYPAISDKIKSGKDKLVKDLNKHRRLLLPNSIPEGSTVMIIDPVRENKFEPKYIGPYTIVRRARNGAYVLKDATGDLLDRHVPADQLKLISKSTQRKIDNSNPIYVVNKIISHRGSPGHYEYLVDWKDWSEQDRTWEPESSFLDSKIIKKYWNELNNSLDQ
jgi:hypothetical protein